MKSIFLPNEGMQDFVPLYPVFDLIQNGIAITDDVNCLRNNVTLIAEN